jgi:DNA helicase-2/ATP-dependent DNA helicase PcrA
MEEERRLLYVAMTRAKDALDLVVPLRYHVTQQARHGDAHVYGARSRFLTPALLRCLTTASWPARAAGMTATAAASVPAATVDVAAKLRALW